MKNITARRGRRTSRRRVAARHLESLEARTLLAADVVFSEIMAHNLSGLSDSFGQRPDWIELQNRGDETVSLEGWRLRDSGATWNLPPIELDAGQYLVVLASGRDQIIDAPFEIHTSFKLSRQGEYLGLISPDDSVVDEFNPYPQQLPDVSYGLASESLTDFLQFFAQPTPGEPNPPAPIVRINEVMASNQGTLTDEDGDFADWVEIHNAGDAPAHLAGWTLRDYSFDWEFPEVSLGAGEYLVVFASGNDRNSIDGELHTSFKLSAAGEGLRLTRPDGILADNFEFPRQRPDISYGRTVDFGQPEFFSVPTPGLINTTDFAGVRFSQPRGNYDQPFDVELSTELPDASIYFTTDGSVPSPDNGQLYTDPVPIVTTTILRSIAYRDDIQPITTSSTYVFPQHVAQQSGEGLPDTWGFVADYEMDPELLNAGAVGNGLRRVPSLSIALDEDDLFSIEDGLFAHPMMEGPAWQRNASVELFQDRASSQFGTTATVRVTGSAQERNPAINPKYSLELSFDSPLLPAFTSLELFENSDTEQYNGFVLRAGHADSWLAETPLEQKTATYLRNRWILEMQRAMGQPTLDGSFVNLYVNGLYWGIYEAVEPVNAVTMAQKLGGTAAEYDLVTTAGIVDGDSTQWDALLAAASEELSNDQAYDAVAGLIHVESLIDYILLKRFAEIDDRQPGSWFAVNAPANGDGFRFLFQRPEYGLGLLPAVDIDLPDSTPEFLFEQMRVNERFRRDFADRLQHHLSSSRVFAHGFAGNLWQSEMDPVSEGMIAERSRWGDYRRDANSLGVNGFRLPMQDQWWTQSNEIVQSYLPSRADSIKEELLNEGMYPDTAPPDVHVLDFGVDTDVEMTAPSGIIYYTLDGADVLRADGSVSDTALVYSSPIRLRSNAVLKARARNGIEWSALTEQKLFLAEPAPLQVVELMYHPQAPAGGNEFDDDDFEFIELKNTGSEIIELSGLEFTSGIDFSFDDSAIKSLAPDEKIVLVRNEEAFKSRYDTAGIAIAGSYGGQLNNGGDQLILEDAVGQTVINVWYSDLWHAITDGGGYSLTAVAVDDQPYPAWKPSNFIGGSPGIEEDDLLPGSVVINEVVGLSGLPDGDWIELHNTTDEPIDISGWFLSDNRTQLQRFRIPDHSVLPPQGFMVFTEAQHFGNAEHPGAITVFGLKQEGETLFLTSGDSAGLLGGYRESMRFDAIEPEVSIGRYEKLDGTVDYVPLVAPSRNASNLAPKVGPVVINEIFYHPIGFAAEYIEIQNISDEPVPLFDPLRPDATWEIRDGVRFSFPSDAVLPAGGRALIVKSDPVIFRERVPVPDDAQVFGPFQGALRNEGEAIALYQATSRQGDQASVHHLVDRVAYDNQSPWSSLAAGKDSSLVRRSPELYGNDAANWTASAWYGSPGRPNVGIDDSPQHVPFSDAFDSETLQSLTGWTFQVQHEGGWFLYPDDAGEGSFMLVSDAWKNPCDTCGFDMARNDATLALEVSKDEPLSVMFDMRSTHGDDLTLQVSDDRRTWHDVTSPIESTGFDFRRYAVDLTTTLEASGLANADRIYLNFRHQSQIWIADPLHLDNFRASTEDVIGPWITDYSYSGPDEGSIDALQIVFSEPIDVRTFSIDDLRITDSLGNDVVPTSISTQDRETWQIEFPPQGTPGTHRFRLGPDVNDAIGNSMNPERYTINGFAPIVSTFEGSTFVAPTTSRSYPMFESFDVADPGQLDGLSFSAGHAGRWTIETANGNSSLFSRITDQISDTGTPSAQTADIKLDLTGESGRTDLELDLKIQRVGSIRENYGWIFLSNDAQDWKRVYGVVAGRDESTHLALDLDELVRRSKLTLDEPIYVRLGHTGSHAGDGMHFDDIRINDLDVFGPWIVSNPQASTSLPIGSYEVSFNEPIDPATLTAESVTIASPTGDAMDAESIEIIDADSVRINFQPRHLAGQYLLTFDSTIRDLAGNRLNQDRDPVSGENADQDGFYGRVAAGPPTPNAFPYRQPFDQRDSNALPGWSFAINGNGQWIISDGNELDDDTFSLITDHQDSRFSSFEAALVVDLSDQADSTELYLDFYARSLRSPAHSGASLFVSGDGDRWSFVTEIQQRDEFISHVIDLDAVLRARHIALDEDVFVRFLHAGQGRLEGIELDSVRLSNENVIGSRIVSQNVTDEQNITRVTVEFDQEMDVASFTPDDARLQLTGVDLHPEMIVPRDDLRTFDLIFATPGMGGIYDLVIGPQVTNRSGIPMNQNRDALNGFAPQSDFDSPHLDDSYTGTVLVAAEPQTLPYLQNFETGALASLSGWVFHTINESGTREGGEWRVVSQFDPRGGYHLLATQFADCWAEHDAIVPIDLSEHQGASDLVLEFDMQRTAKSDKSREGLRNMGQLLVGTQGGEFTQVGDSSHLLGQNPAGRLADLNEDGVTDLVPTFGEYVHYRFDLDQLLQAAQVAADGVVLLNFHRLAFWSSDVTTFDDIRVYRESQVDPDGPSVEDVQIHDAAEHPQLWDVDQLTVRFDRAAFGLDASDLQLTRNGSVIPIPDSIAFVSRDNISWVANLREATDHPGEYQLRLLDGTAGVTDVFGTPLTTGFSITWTDQRETGDVNLDGVFNSTDLVIVFQASEYEDRFEDNSSWAEGDWNDDGDFDSGDLVLAFQHGSYSAAGVADHLVDAVPDLSGVFFGEALPQKVNQAKNTDQLEVAKALIPPAARPIQPAWDPAALDSLFSDADEVLMGERVAETDGNSDDLANTSRL